MECTIIGNSQQTWSDVTQPAIKLFVTTLKLIIYLQKKKHFLNLISFIPQQFTNSYKCAFINKCHAC